MYGKLSSVTILALCLVITSCGYGVLNFSSKSSATITGSVPSLEGLISRTDANSFSAYAATCSAKVHLYGLDEQDHLITPSVASAVVKPDGTFTIKSPQIDFKKSNVDYLLEVESDGTCDVVLQRPLTWITNPQTITSFSTLISFARNASLNRKLFEASKDQIESLLKDTGSIPTTDAAFAELQSHRSSAFNSIFFRYSF